MYVMLKLVTHVIYLFIDWWKPNWCMWCWS